VTHLTPKVQQSSSHVSIFLQYIRYLFLFYFGIDNGSFEKPIKWNFSFQNASSIEYRTWFNMRLDEMNFKQYSIVIVYLIVKTKIFVALVLGFFMKYYWVYMYSVRVSSFGGNNVYLH